ncbi:MAG: tryptophan halogenase family protein [Alphaproteobacteria bacterium]
MAKPVTNVTIVGGGTAGWMTALTLVTIMKWRPQRDDFKITLIESPNIPTVGVGEATVPSITMLLSQLDVPERDFFARCNATFKLGVLFANWNQWEDGSTRDFFHPFTEPRFINTMNPGYHFRAFASGDRTDFCDSVLPVLSVAGRNLGPRKIGGGDYERDLRYAYHLDASRLAEFLRDISVERGVDHVRDDMVSYEKDERGYISSLNLERTGKHEVELVIDCTGFRSLLLGEAMEEPFISYNEFLPNDRACAVQIPHQEGAPLRPYTTSTALTAGWSWNVPLYHRVGTGYVYSSQFKSDDEAKQELLDHLGPIADGLEPRTLFMRIGRTERSWVKNVVAIGLSGGFIEPLESTAIYMIEVANRQLVTFWPDADFPDAMTNQYNKVMATLQDEVRDFIVLHYRLNNRSEPYWKAARHDMPTPDSLAEDFERWRLTLPNDRDHPEAQLFPATSNQMCLFGKGFYDIGGAPGALPNIVAEQELSLESIANPVEWSQFSEFVLAQKKKLVSELPDHRELVTSIRGAVEAPASGLDDAAML